MFQKCETKHVNDDTALSIRVPCFGRGLGVYGAAGLAFLMALCASTEPARASTAVWYYDSSGAVTFRDFVQGNSGYLDCFFQIGGDAVPLGVPSTPVVGIAAFMDGNSARPSAFVTSTGGALEKVYWSGTQWQSTSFGPPSATVAAGGALASAQFNNGSHSVQLAFVNGNDGKVYQANDSGWRPGGPDTLSSSPGFTLDSLDATATVGSYGSTKTNVVAFGAGSDNSGNAGIYVGTGTAGTGSTSVALAWSHQSPPPGTTLYGQLGAVTYFDGSQQWRTFVRGNDTKLHVLWASAAQYSLPSAGSWQWDTPQIFVGAPAGGIGHNISAIEYDDGTAHRIRVFVGGSGNLWSLNWDSDNSGNGGWSWLNHGKPGPDVDASASPNSIQALTYFYTSRNIDVFVKGSDGLLYVRRWNGVAWGWTIGVHT